MPTLYDRLGVAPEASTGELREAYVALARRHHPDAGGDAGAMRDLNEAWEVLSDPGRRRAYDRTLPPRATHRTAPGGDGGAPDLDLDADLDLDLLDDRPRRPSGTSSPLSVAPAAVFVAAIGTGVLGIMLAIPELLAFAGFLTFLSVMALAAVALLTLRGPR